ncbi:13824_t:CDS:2 [Acaulospora colombiana]|uniref:13824_t:CDS:1 n=1 Tax=Acaulospora colombiana TaxID=27376 RepID=A0ACA9K8V5_9GLOM|nr:13824_t:CDS:2 [Acaulospora colombiana]
MPEATPLTIRPSSVYISSSIYTSSPTSFVRSTSTHEISKPTFSPTPRLQSSSALTRPSTIYTSANIDQSFKAIRRQRTRKSNNNPSRRDGEEC